MQSARTTTGLSDFGERSFQDGLERLVKALNTESRLNAVGEAGFTAQLTDHLVQRLHVEDWYARHPEIDEEPVVAPLIGLGLPRTGSTALACLLGEDPAARSLLNWEAMRPTPPSGFAPASISAKIAHAEASIPPRGGGAYTYNEGYIFDGIRMIPAKVRQAPWLRRIIPKSENVSLVLESELGETHIKGETVLSTFRIGNPDLPGMMHLQQAAVRYEWAHSGEETEAAYGMIERSDQAAAIRI
jgi:hypothetical protein